MKKLYQIAIDGFSSCGKSTLAKALAKKLGFLFVDSGAMYRAVCYFFIQNKINFYDEAELVKALDSINIILKSNETVQKVFLNNDDVTEEIRSMQVSNLVSEVAALSPVRKKLVAEQQKLAKFESIVMDGRDIGTIVFPNASIKFFITADPMVRAQRRYEELLNKGNLAIDFNLVLENLSHRDQIDSTRADSPLTKASDAIVIDNTKLSESDQLNIAYNHLIKKFPEFHKP
ncbi:MAG TPA: (d)CMP kinase [Saprospiraceae bacterium]|nr:(d)CMP kinase [Saprospiraceae bacterium]HUN15571.1 (d)CMP kinase [Saprospiraceae bacterium]